MSTWFLYSIEHRFWVEVYTVRHMLTRCVSTEMALISIIVFFVLLLLHLFGLNEDTHASCMHEQRNENQNIPGNLYFLFSDLWLLLPVKIVMRIHIHLWWRWSHTLIYYGVLLSADYDDGSVVCLRAIFWRQACSKIENKKSERGQKTCSLFQATPHSLTHTAGTML